MSLALPTPSALAPGTRFDRYELLCPVAHGGMASVWLARLTGKHGFEKLFAVKTILPQYASDLRFQQMFLDEARLASHIEDPNVAHIIDLGEQDEILYLVMEWVDGDSLSKLNRAVLKKGHKLPIGILFRILADICSGLHAAHELKAKDGKLLGVVHRDVSPQNILVTTKGTAKLIDFGVAKARDRAGGDTSAGQLKGKIQYMAPEQALGRHIDRRADIWSLAAVAYHLLAGAPPFDGANELATLHMLTSGTPPPPLPEHIPIAIADPIFRGLVANVDERIATSRDMQRALEQAMRDAGMATSTSDVADFATHYLGDRIEARHRAIQQALTDASERKGAAVGPLQPRSGDSASGVSQVKPSPVPDAAISASSLDARSMASAHAGSHSGTSHPASAGAPGGSYSGHHPMGPSLDPGSYRSTSEPGSTATLGSAASEINWPPLQPPPWRRWAILGAVAGLGLFALIVGSFVAIRSPAPAPASAVEPSTAAQPPADTALLPAPIPAPPVDTASASASSPGSAAHPAIKPPKPGGKSPSTTTHGTTPAPAHGTKNPNDYGF